METGEKRRPYESSAGEKISLYTDFPWFRVLN